MKVARYNYAAQLDGELDAVLDDIRTMLVEGRYLLCSEVREFERQFAEYVGASHARTVSTGTDAITIGLKALGIGRGDEVVTQANTFHATVAAIRLVDATPVLVDCDERSYLMDTRQLSDVITDRTVAVIPVHLYGKATPMQPLLELAERLSLPILEDAAQAHGAEWNGRRVGGIGTLGFFSFHPSKNLAAAGDGGAIVCRDARLDEAVRQNRELGQVGQNHHVRVGYHSKLDAIQARILSAKLRHLDAWNGERRRVARSYRAALEGLPIGFQAWDEGEQHVFHLFQVRTDRRDALLADLLEAGVDAVVRYPTPIHLQPAFADLGWRPGQFPVAERLARELLCLPIRPDMRESEVSYVADRVRRFFGGR